MNRNHIKRYFDSVAEDYSRRSESGIGWSLRQKEATAIATLIGSNPLGDVLELGCGTGYYSRRLKAQGCNRLVCVDFSPAMLDNCNIPGVVKVQADIQDYVSEDQFDLIICAGVLEFLDRPETIFRNARKMLRPDGSLITLLPQVSLLGWVYQMFHRFHRVHVRLFQFRDLERWAANADLSIDVWQPVPLFSIVAKLSRA